jgi:hypothetical protein
MQRFRFPIAVALTSLALVAVLVGAGGLLVGNALAMSPFSGAQGGPWGGPWANGHAGWQTSQLPPEVAGLVDVPAGERFSHLRSVRVQFTDKDNTQVTADITPGTATTVTPTSVTIAANDGSTHTYTVDAKTVVHASQNDKVIVATLNNSQTATAVMAFNPDRFGPHGAYGR